MTTKGNVIRIQRLEIQYPIMLNVMSVEETKEYHLKKLEKLSEESLAGVPQIDEPNEEQEQWINRKMKASSRSWEVWDQ